MWDLHCWEGDIFVSFPRIRDSEIKVAKRVTFGTYYLTIMVLYHIAFV